MIWNCCQISIKLPLCLKRTEGPIINQRPHSYLVRKPPALVKLEDPTWQKNITFILLWPAEAYQLTSHQPSCQGQHQAQLDSGVRAEMQNCLRCPQKAENFSKWTKSDKDFYGDIALLNKLRFCVVNKVTKILMETWFAQKAENLSGEQKETKIMIEILLCSPSEWRGGVCLVSKFPKMWLLPEYM